MRSVRKFALGAACVAVATALVPASADALRWSEDTPIEGNVGGTARPGTAGTRRAQASAPGPVSNPADTAPPVDFRAAQAQPLAEGVIPGTDIALRWHFSEYLPDAVQSAPLGGTDCTIHYGIVRDPDHGMADFRIYSGTTINCLTLANTITAGSVVQYCTSANEAECGVDSPNWFNATDPNPGTLTNTFGSGDTLLVSPEPGICRGTVTWVRAAAVNVGVDGLTYPAIVGVAHNMTTAGGCITATQPSPVG